MKHIHFLRHGEANHLTNTWGGDDSQRPLNQDGKKKMADQARGMKKLGIKIDVIVTSPYVRARQTADAVAKEYRLADRMIETELIESGSSFEEFEKAMGTVDGDSVLVVGHAPDLGVWAGHLTVGDALWLGKGTLVWARIRDGSLRPGTARLKAILPADLTAAAGRL